VGVEPVPDLFEAITGTHGLTVEHLAISAEARPVTLFLSESIVAATIDQRLSEPDAPTVTVAGITFTGLLDRFGLDRVPLVKVDIEGAEIEMFKTTPAETLQRIDQFSIEFHDFLDPRQADDVQRVKQRLLSAGFSEMAFSTDNTDVLFVNQARVPFTSAQKAAAAVLYKYPRGISRNLQRRYDDWQRARRAT
jgi:FkbM family methyltransferase